jgi:hypothetical protein
MKKLLMIAVAATLVGGYASAQSPEYGAGMPPGATPVVFAGKCMDSVSAGLYAADGNYQSFIAGLNVQVPKQKIGIMFHPTDRRLILTITEDATTCFFAEIDQVVVFTPDQGQQQ